MRNLWLLLLVVCSSHRPAAAGSGAHGADIDADQNNVWFLGPEPISYCVTLEPGSAVDQAEAVSLVNEAFAKWYAFFTRHRYTDLAFGVPDKTILQDGKLPDGQGRKLSLVPVEIAHCGAPTRQLEIKFSKHADKNWTLDSEHAFGAAIRGPYDHVSYRTGGTVWISTALKNRPERLHVLLHELGHVFGMSHNSTYVMFDKIARLIQTTRQGGAGAQAMLGMIESPSWKYLIWPGDTLELTTTIISGTNAVMSSPASNVFLPTSRIFVPGLTSPAKLRYLGKRAGEHNFQLDLRSSTGTAVLDGHFYRRYHSFEVGPSLFTFWVGKTGLFSGKLYLEMMRSEANELGGGGSRQPPLEGTFRWNHQLYPAVIEFPYGAVVKLFDPNNLRWFTLSSYPFEVTP
jgi:hypothetical protein